MVYSFYAEHSVNMRVASKSAICSIFCTREDKFDTALKELQTRVRDCRLILNQYSQTGIDVSPDDTMFEELQDYVRKTFNGAMQLIRVKDFDEFPEREQAIDSLIHAGSENPRHELGDVQFKAETTIDMKDHPTTLIAAVPIRGIITQIPRCAQYTLYCGKLAILSDNDAIKKKDSEITKIIYVVADIYDDLQINEYRTADGLAYRDRHLFSASEVDSIEEKSFDSIEELDDNIGSLFQVNGSVNLFPLGGLPKGVWRKNNELLTRL